MPLLPDSLWCTQRRWRHGNDGEELPAWCGLNPALGARHGCARTRRASAASIRTSACIPIREPRAWRLFGAAMAKSGDVVTGDGCNQRHPQTRSDQLSSVSLSSASASRTTNFCATARRDGSPRRLLKGKIPDLVLNEKRRGLQAADWHLRLGRERRRLDDELAALAARSQMAARFDLPRLRQALADWPEQTPVDDPRQSQALCLALPRALATARFIRHVEGQNA